jgi:hypothetical protein
MALKKRLYPLPLFLPTGRFFRTLLTQVGRLGGASLSPLGSTSKTASWLDLVLYPRGLLILPVRLFCMKKPLILCGGGDRKASEPSAKLAIGDYIFIGMPCCGKIWLKEKFSSSG